MSQTSPAEYQNRTYDASYQMRILSVIAISFVILGHINFYAYGYIKTSMTELGTLYGWFPYYSFHLALFLFISGYFYKDLPDNKSFIRSFGLFISRKAKNLLVPFYIINGIFLLANTIMRPWGFTFGTRFSLSAWLISPWTKLYTISFTTPTWYLISLFIAELYFVVLRKLFQLIFRKEIIREILLLVFVLALGIAAVCLRNNLKLSETAAVYLRSVVMLFFIQLGLVYRKHMERLDTVASGWYFAIVVFLQFLLLLFSGDSVLSPGLFGLSGFEGWGYDYFLGGLTGLAFWLRISRLLAQIPRKSKVLLFIGANTKYIMSFHVFGWFLLNALFSLFYSHRIGITFLKDFNIQTWHSFLYYAYTGNPRMIILYFLAGMVVSLLIAAMIQFVKNKIKLVFALRKHQ